MQPEITTTSIRIERELRDAADIMATLLGQSLSRYIADAVAARLAEDIESNAVAYETTRKARQAQEKGA